MVAAASFVERIPHRIYCMVVVAAGDSCFHHHHRNQENIRLGGYCTHIPARHRPGYTLCSWEGEGLQEGSMKRAVDQVVALRRVGAPSLSLVDWHGYLHKT